jgi:hypothetical protein
MLFEGVSQLLSNLQENIRQLKEFGVIIDCNINVNGLFEKAII